MADLLNYILMKIPNEYLNRFASLWHNKTGSKLTREQANVEFHRLISLVRFQIDLAINKENITK